MYEKLKLTSSPREIHVYVFNKCWHIIIGSYIFFSFFLSSILHKTKNPKKRNNVCIKKNVIMGTFCDAGRRVKPALGRVIRSVLHAATQSFDVGPRCFLYSQILRDKLLLFCTACFFVFFLFFTDVYFYLYQLLKLIIIYILLWAHSLLLLSAYLNLLEINKFGFKFGHEN